MKKKQLKAQLKNAQELRHYFADLAERYKTEAIKLGYVEPTWTPQPDNAIWRQIGNEPKGTPDYEEV